MSELTRGRFILRAVLTAMLVVLAGAVIYNLLGDRQRAEAERAFKARLGAYLGARPRVADERNAAVPLIAGAQALIISAKDKSALGGMTQKPASGWTAGEREYLRSVLEINGPGLELLYRSGGMRESDFGLDPSAGSQNLDDFKSRMPLLKLLWAQRLLWLDANEAWIANDRTRFAAATAAMASLASALERETPLMITGLIGVASEKIFHSAAGMALASTACDLETVTLLSSDLPSEDLTGSWRRVIAGEGLPWANLVSEWEKPKTLSWYTRAYDGVRGMIVGSRIEAQRFQMLVVLAGSLEVPYGSSPDWAAARTAEVKQRSGPYLGTLMPNLLNAAGRYQTALAGRQLVRTALWVREQGLRTGAYPTSLAGSSDGAGSDAFSGSPLVYEVHVDGSATLGIKNGDDLWKRLQQNIKSSLPFTLRLPPPSR